MPLVWIDPRATWHFDENQGSTTTDAVSGQVATLSNAQNANWITGVIGSAALHFDTWNNILSIPAPPQPAMASFTVSMWVRPSAVIASATQSQAAVTSVAGQRFVISPTTSATGVAAFGVSVGTNGVNVYTQLGSNYYVLLAWTGVLSGWTSLTVVFNQNSPALYVNGVFATAGLQSAATVSSYFTMIGCQSGFQQCYLGDLDELVVYLRTQQTAEVLLNYNGDVQLCKWSCIYLLDSLVLMSFSCHASFVFVFRSEPAAGILALQ